MLEFNAFIVALDLVVILALLIFTRITPWRIFLGSSVALYLLEVMELERVLQGFTNPSLLVLLLLFIVAIPLERTTLMRKATNTLLEGRPRQAIWRMSVLSGLFSAFINNTAVVAAMLGPLKKQQKFPPSRLLLPLSYASILGGTLTLIGTSTNLIVNGFVQQAGYDSLGFFEFSMIGVPVFIACFFVLVLLAPKVLPDQKIQFESPTQDYFLERRLIEGSPLIGRTVQENGLRQLERIFLVEVIRDNQIMAPVNPQEVLREDDVLVFTGDLSAIELLAEFPGLERLEVFDQSVRENLVEVIVSPTAGVVGHTIKQVNFRTRFDAAVVAVRRGDQRLEGGLGGLTLKAGDALVLAVGDDFNRQGDVAADFIVIGDVENLRVLNGVSEWGVFAGFAVIVALGATGFVPLIKGLIVLLGILIATKIVSINDVRARFPFQLVIVIGGALALSQAMFDTGLVAVIGEWIGSVLGGLSPFAAVAGVFMATWLFTELVTNNAAAAIMFPLAMAVASQWNLGYMPFVMAVAFGASASFVSPYGYQTNLMVFTAGNYRIGQYVRLGVPILVTYTGVALAMIYWSYL